MFLERDDGSYLTFDAENAEHVKVYAAQAAKALTDWLERYGAVLVLTDSSTGAIDGQIARLRAMAGARRKLRPV
jgi:cysteine synthase